MQKELVELYDRAAKTASFLDENSSILLKAGLADTHAWIVTLDDFVAEIEALLENTESEE